MIYNFSCYWTTAVVTVLTVVDSIMILSTPLASQATRSGPQAGSDKLQGGIHRLNRIRRALGSRPVQTSSRGGYTGLTPLDVLWAPGWFRQVPGRDTPAHLRRTPP